MPSLPVGIDASGASIGAGAFASAVSRMRVAASTVPGPLALITRGLTSVHHGALRASAGLGVLAGGMGALGLTMKGVKLAAEFETTAMGFETMLKSGEAAIDMLARMRKFAEKTPFQFTELTDITKRMLAYGFAADEVLDTLRILGDATAALGGKSYVLDRITIALGQMRAKSSISAEEMRQLAESGISAWEMLAEGIGVSVPKAMELSRKKQIDFQKGFDSIIQGMEQRFGGAMDRISKTAAGVWSNLIDVLEFSLTSFGESVLQAFNIRPKLGDAVNAVSDMQRGMIESLVSVEYAFKHLDELVGLRLASMAAAIQDWIAGPWQEFTDTIQGNRGVPQGGGATAWLGEFARRAGGAFSAATGAGGGTPGTAKEVGESVASVLEMFGFGGGWRKDLEQRKRPSTIATGDDIRNQIRSAEDAYSQGLADTIKERLRKFGMGPGGGKEVGGRTKTFFDRAEDWVKGAGGGIEDFVAGGMEGLWKRLYQVGLRMKVKSGQAGDEAAAAAKAPREPTLAQGTTLSGSYWGIAEAFKGAQQKPLQEVAANTQRLAEKADRMEQTSKSIDKALDKIADLLKKGGVMLPNIRTGGG